MIDLTDRVAVVTGGASGIGRGICLSLAGQGADIAVADLDQPTAMSVAAEVTGAGRDAMAVAIDVSNKASVSEAIGQVLDRFGRIDILVNNAGVLGAPGWWERDPPDDDDWDLILAVIHKRKVPSDGLYSIPGCFFETPCIQNVLGATVKLIST